MKSVLAKLLLAAALALSGAGNAMADDTSATLRLQGFGGDAQLKAIQNAVARFNEKYPNVTVEVAMDPITAGWGDYVTKVLSQFNANNAYDVYGTAIETFSSFTSRGLFLPLDDYIAQIRPFPISIPPFSSMAPTKGRLISFRSAGTTL